MAIVIAALASMLALPAALYFWKHPDLPNGLSLLLSIGIFAAFLTLVRNVVAVVAVGVVVLAMNLIEIVHILAYGGLISLGGVEAVLYVDPIEAREFVTDHRGLFFLGGAVFVLFAGLAWAKRRLDDLRLRQRLSVAAVALVAPFGLLTADLFFLGSERDVYLPTRILEHYATYLGVNPLTHTISGIAAALGERRELADLAKVRDGFTFNATRSRPPPERETYIVVIGESSRSGNWSLYGYGRPTNPLLAATPGLVVFEDAVSPATTTGRSLPLALSFATVEDPQAFYRTRSFVSAFREAGFRTYWLSNQGTQRTAVGNQIALVMGEADEVATTNFGFWNTKLDEALLPELDRVLASPEPRKLIVIHTLGSHTNYRQRFPAGLELATGAPSVRATHPFAGITDAEAAIIEDYDRTIAYTDRLLTEVIARQRTSGDTGAMVYFSDHGQRLFDDDRHQKGHGFSGFKRQDAEIPLLVWLSDAFGRANPQALAAIEANAKLPVSTSGLAASLLDLAGISANGMDPAQSFLGPSFKPSERKVLTTDGRIVTVDNR